MRLTTHEHQQLLALGGAAWVREQIDHASRPMISVAFRAIGSTELVYNQKALKATLRERQELLMDATMMMTSDLNTLTDQISF